MQNILNYSIQLCSMAIELKLASIVKYKIFI